MPHDQRPHDRTAELVFGINLSIFGLPCRGGCHRVFAPASQSSAAALSASAADRDAHEVAEHDYHHRIEPTLNPWAFTKQFSSGGRSLLGKRSTHAP